MIRPTYEIRRQLRRLRLVKSRVMALGAFDVASELTLKSLLRNEAELLEELQAARKQEGFSRTSTRVPILANSQHHPTS